MKNSFLVVLSILACSSAFTSVAKANPAIICDGQNGNHKIHLELWDEVVMIRENWEGAYKTTANFKGLSDPQDGYLVLRFQESFRYGTLTFKDKNSATLDYLGFLPPDSTGTVEMDCK